MKKHLISIQKVNEVKEILNSSSWTGEYCFPDKINERDENIGLNILMDKSFGTYMLKKIILEGNFEAFIDWLGETPNSNQLLAISSYNEVEAEYIAIYYADEIAKKKLENYIWKFGDKPGYKLFFPDSYVFKIIL